MLHGSQLSVWPKGRRRGERGKKIKRIFISMKETERISQCKTHQPEIPA